MLFQLHPTTELSRLFEVYCGICGLQVRLWHAAGVLRELSPRKQPRGSLHACCSQCFMLDAYNHAC